MKSIIWTSVPALLLAATVGCGGESQAPAASIGPAGTSGGQQKSEAAPQVARVAKVPPVEAEPDVIVSTFLDSLRNGDDATAEALLTDKARIETQNANMKVQPQGSKSAHYQVGTVQFASQNMDQAHVGSAWEDTRPDGSYDRYNITWVLRKEKCGWRIVGLITKPQPDEPDLFLNFENPKDMMAKVQQADAKQSAGGSGEAQTAQTPPDPNLGGQR